MGAAIGATGTSLAALRGVMIDVANSMKASSGVIVRGRDEPIGEVDGPVGPSSAVAGAANHPMAQSATAMETCRTTAFFFME